MRACIGNLNTECVVIFDVQIEDVDHFDSSTKFPIVKDSKSLEKGVGYRVEENKFTQFEIDYTGFDNKLIKLCVTEVKTMPLLRIYCKLPKPELLEVSEFFIEGHFEIEKVNLADSKTIRGSVLHEKLTEKKTLTIDKKLFIDIIGEPEIKQVQIETEFGSISRIRSKLDVEI